MNVRLTKPVTMILLSLGRVAGPVGTPLVAAFADFTDFLTPPTGALALVTDALAGLCPRRPRFAFRRVLRISSRDWSSLPDMLTNGIEYSKWILGAKDWQADCSKRFDRLKERLKALREGRAAGSEVLVGYALEYGAKGASRMMYLEVKSS